MSNTAKRWVLMSVLSLAAFAQASASSIIFHFNTVHSGATPGGTAPWATMTMSDIIGGGVQVSLTNSATNPAGQFISELNLLFNVLPTGFSFASDPYVQAINLGNYIDAGLSFNVEVRFKVAPPGERLLPGGTSTFTLSGVSTSDFAGLNTSAMVHIQNIPPGGDSSKVIAPEPGSLIAIGTGLVSLLGLRRRRK
jgi:hypothetical protein